MLITSLPPTHSQKKEEDKDRKKKKKEKKVQGDCFQCLCELAHDSPLVI